MKRGQQNTENSIKRRIGKITVLALVILLPLAGSFGYSRFKQFKVQTTDSSSITNEHIEPQSANSPTNLTTNRSTVFVHNNTDGTDEGFNELLRLMKENQVDFYQTIGNGDIVILKVNSQWHQRGGTNVDLVESVIDAILAHPKGFMGEIIIADNGQGQFGSKGRGGSLDWDQSNGKDQSRSMSDLAESYDRDRVSIYLWDTITRKRVNDFDKGDLREGFVIDNKVNPKTKITVSYPKFKTTRGSYVSFKKGIWDTANQSFNSDKLKVINMPVLKTHMIYGVTGAVKNYMGVPSQKLTRNSHSTVGIGSMGTLMAETRVPALNIMDAIYINAKTTRGSQGPSTSYNKAYFAKKVLISTDPVALDYYATGAVLYPAITGSGGKLKKMNRRDLNEPGTFAYWLRLSMEELNDAGYQTTMDESMMDVFELE